VSRWPAFDGPLTDRPDNRAQVIKTFGDPTRNGQYLRVCNPKWREDHIVDCYHEDAIVGLERFDFQCHKLAEPYFREAFRRAFEATPDYIDRAASFVFRHIRHDPKRPLSMHSWGIAGDINSDDNGAVYFQSKKYPFPRPEPWSEKWVEIWPHGVPPEVVEAFESCGFRWGGRWGGSGSKDDFCDPMHFELCGPGDVRV
jgi:hypothetical protein